MSSSIRNSSYIVHNTCVKITEWGGLSVIKYIRIKKLKFDEFLIVFENICQWSEPMNNSNNVTKMKCESCCTKLTIALFKKQQVFIMEYSSLIIKYYIRTIQMKLKNKITETKQRKMHWKSSIELHLKIRSKMLWKSSTKMQW